MAKKWLRNILAQMSWPQFTTTIPKSTKNHSENFLLVYFNFAYILCISPFRLKTQNSTGKIIATSNPVQKLLCATVHSTALLLLLCDLRTPLSSIEESRRLNPFTYFELANVLLYAAYYACFLYMIWTKSRHISGAVNFIVKNKTNLPSGCLKIGYKLVWCIVCTTYAAMAIYRGVTMEILSLPEARNVSIWDLGLIAKGRRALFMHPIQTSSEDTFTFSGNLTWLDYACATVAGIGTMGSRVYTYYRDLFMLSTALTLWSTCYLFAGTIQGNNSLSSWSSVRKVYAQLKTLANLINGFVSPLQIPSVGEGMVLIATTMDYVLIETDPLLKLHKALLLSCYFSIFILFADVPCQIQALKGWLAVDENRRDIPIDQYIAILDEIDSAEIGIRGGNMFTITYSLLWNATATAVTIFTICIQTRTTPE